MGLVAVREEAFGKRPDGADALRARAVAAAEMLDRIATEFTAVPGHRFNFNRTQELTWNFGYPGMSIAGHIGRWPSDPSEPEQLHVEVRVHLGESPRATITAQQGSRFLGGHRTLLAPPDCFLRAETYDGLRQRIVECLNATLAPFHADAPASPTP